MFIGISERVAPILTNLRLFINEVVIPNEDKYAQELQADRWQQPAIMETMKKKARDTGLFNLFLNSDTQSFNQVEYAHLAEQMGRTDIAAEVFNCASPDTGNMEVLARYGTKQQQEDCLLPLLSGEIRSGFAMTEPAVASSDATNIASRAHLDGDSWVLEGEKSWVSGAGDPHCKFLIVMCVTDPNEGIDKRQSMLIVPMQSEGVGKSVV